MVQTYLLVKNSLYWNKEKGCGIINKNRKKRGVGMSIESRSRQYGKIFDHWHIRGNVLGYGSGGKTAVFKLSRSDSSRGESALKVINLIEEFGNIDNLSDSQREKYEAAREICSKKAEREVWLMDELRGKTNIVDYLDHTFSDWEEDGRFGRDLLIRMELLTDLRSVLRTGKIFRESEVIQIGKDICTALTLCHKKNILHRDVKPENIFFNTDGDYKLGDFGISRVLDGCADTYASTGICTYGYCPLEQLKGKYDKRVDIYSLGLVLYELSNRNRLPFAVSTRVTERELSLRFSGVKFPEPVDAGPELAKVILKACSYKPEDRYQSAEDFLEALNRIPSCVDVNIKREDPYKTVRATQAERFGQDLSENKKRRTSPREDLYGEKGIHRILKTIFITGSILALCIASVWVTIQVVTHNKDDVPVDTQPQAETITEAYDYEEIHIVSIDAGRDHTVALYSDGTIQAIGSSQFGQRDTSDWTDIKQISTMRFHTVGINSDGTAVAAGLNTNGQCNLAGWENIIDISAGDHHTVGLKSDGIVVATGNNQYGECNVSDWSDIIAVEAAFNNTIGLKSDGTVLIAGAFGHTRLGNWSDIVAISAGDAHFVGLRSDGTVVAAGTNNHGQCDLSGWSDIVSVCAGAAYTVGLRSDGTVLVAGINDCGQHEAQRWKDIVQIASGLEHIVGIQSDGTLVAVGANDNGQCAVDAFKNVISEGSAAAKPSVEVGDILSFGHYEQDGNQINGSEEIKWTVLDVQAGKALLLSEYALDSQPYNLGYEAVTWETSTIRHWLNHTFLDTAFTAGEQNAIALTTVDNSMQQGNGIWGKQTQKDTKDYVFLLSYAESELYFVDDESRCCIPTNYAILMGAQTKNFTYGKPDTGWWWLRSPGEKQYHAAFVSYDGERHSNAVGNDYLSVRPALWVNLDSDALLKAEELPEDRTASVANIIREKVPIVTYAMTGSDKVYSYNDSALSRQTDWYYLDSREDEIVIMDVSPDGNALFVRYPSKTTDAGFRDCWFAAEDILGALEPMIYTFDAVQQMAVYRFQSGNSLSYYGTIQNQLECCNLGTYQTGEDLVIYPLRDAQTMWGINVTEKMALIP